jgi:hypothetical protein
VITRQRGFRPGDQPGRCAVEEADPRQIEDEAPGLAGQDLVQVQQAPSVDGPHDGDGFHLVQPGQKRDLGGQVGSLRDARPTPSSSVSRSGRLPVTASTMCDGDRISVNP